jgi:tetratricopeptide (TPR) repeat protein
MFLAGAATLAAQGQPSPRDLIEAGHWKRARAVVESRAGSDAETLYLKATLKQAAGDLDAAEKLAEQAVSANPKEADYHYRLSDITGSKAQHASAFKQIGLGRTFKKECDLALSLNPNHIWALFNMMEFYLHAPGIIGGDKSKANTIAEKLMTLNPAKGVQARIEIASAEKQNSKIDDIVNNALSMKAETFDMHLMQAEYLASRKEPRYDEALQHAREAMRMHPDRVGPHGLIAAICARQQKWPELDAAIAQAEKDVPDNLVPYFRAARALSVTQTDLPRAERYLRKYLTQEPELTFPAFAVAHWRLGQVLDQQGRKSEAVAEWQTAVKLDPNSPAKQEMRKR